MRFRAEISALVILLSLGVAHPSMAQDAATAPGAGPTAADLAAGAQASPANVQGFRSARFGMTEAEVRASIVADFGVDEAAISVGSNVADRTRILSVAVPGVLEGGGGALVSYVLGYKSSALDQVSVLWSAQTGSDIDGDKLVANGAVLQSYFLQNGFPTESSVVDVTVPDGVVMFRGTDEKGRMALLLLRGSSVAATGGDGQAQFVPTGLLLSYLADPANPDIFTVTQGQF